MARRRSCTRMHALQDSVPSGAARSHPAIMATQAKPAVPVVTIRSVATSSFLKRHARWRRGRAECALGGRKEGSGTEDPMSGTKQWAPCARQASKEQPGAARYGSAGTQQEYGGSCQDATLAGWIRRGMGGSTCSRGTRRPAALTAGGPSGLQPGLQCPCRKGPIRLTSH